MVLGMVLGMVQSNPSPESPDAPMIFPEPIEPEASAPQEIAPQVIDPQEIAPDEPGAIDRQSNPESGENSAPDLANDGPNDEVNDKVNDESIAPAAPPAATPAFDPVAAFFAQEQSDSPGLPIAGPDFRSGFVGIVGRPNVGKSTLMNQLVGQKIAIVSPISQTTRNRMRGILTLPEAQIIFVDTPGIHKPHHQLGKILVQNARAAISATDVLLFVVDGSVPAGGGDRFVAEWLARADVPVILGLNKLDLCEPDSAEAIEASYQALVGDHGWPIVRFSALEGDGTDTLLRQLVDRLDPGPYYYPPDLVSDRPERFVIGELIREQILHHTSEEVPHSVAVELNQIEETPKLTRILATIHVERSSQKGILIGRQGAMLKAIGSAARQQIQALIDGQVYLELFVRVQPKWRQSKANLADFGYRIED